MVRPVCVTRYPFFPLGRRSGVGVHLTFVAEPIGHVPAVDDLRLVGFRSFLGIKPGNKDTGPPRAAFHEPSVGRSVTRPREKPARPRAAKPMSIRAQVEDSGTLWANASKTTESTWLDEMAKLYGR